MLSQIPEKHMHLTRSILTGGWVLLIASLFYDPISAQLTNPGNLWMQSVLDNGRQWEVVVLSSAIAFRIWIF
jgi:hypothetical protein